MAHNQGILLYTDKSSSYKSLEEIEQLHLLGGIQSQAKLFAYTDELAEGLDKFRTLFPEEYQLCKHVRKKGETHYELQKISPVFNTKVLYEMPDSIASLQKHLCDQGYVLIRLSKPLDERQLLKLIGGEDELLDYRNGLNQRDEMPGSIFSYVTQWSPSSEILPHNELSHHPVFPRWVCFFSKTPAEYGGETTLFDCAQAFEKLSHTTQQELLSEDIIFIRQHPLNASDLSKQSVNQKITYWENAGYECKLISETVNGELCEFIETRLARPMVYYHKGQACLHASIVGVAAYWYRSVMPDQKPQLVLQWKHGSPFPDVKFRELEEAVKSARIFYCNHPQANDLIILDNLRIAHGRTPFIGNRAVGILMSGSASFSFESCRWQTCL